jgi:hypothetical protein
MTPSVRRWILVASMMGANVPVMQALAQQTGDSSAQKAPAKAAPAKAVAKKQAVEKAPKGDPAAAQGQVEDGVNALAQGRVDAAVASLTSALSASSLPQNQTARALYYRGVAYRRQAKPAQAISDLTNALWIKGGLTEEQRQDAFMQRSGAYREAGLPDQGAPGNQRVAAGAKAGSPSTPFSTVAPPAPNGSSTTMTAGGGGFFGSLFGGAAPTPATQSAPQGNASAPATTASVVPRVAPAQSPAARPPATQPVASVPAGSVGQGDKPATRLVPVLNTASSLPTGFQEIGDSVRMVEVSTSARAAQPTAAAAPVIASAPEPNAKAGSATGSRRVEKEVANAQTQAATRAAAAPSPVPQRVASAPQAVAPVASGRVAAGGSVPAPRGGAAGVRIQVAAVRTAEEAQGVSAKLQAQYARELGGRAPVVDQVSAGNFGSFFRVQVGPFAPTRETEELCEKLKAGGLDCRLVSQ